MFALVCSFHFFVWFFFSSIRVFIVFVVFFVLKIIYSRRRRSLLPFANYHVAYEFNNMTFPRLSLERLRICSFGFISIYSHSQSSPPINTYSYNIYFLINDMTFTRAIYIFFLYFLSLETLQMFWTFVISSSTLHHL